MPARELVILGSASQTPTRHRNHNGYLLRWDDRSVLFDPGEGTQRQLLLAGASPTGIHHICVTHFHGDHCLGLPGMLQRLSLDRVAHTVEVLFPASGSEYFERLRHASAYHDRLDVRPVPVADDGPASVVGPFAIEAVRLDHDPETFGWRVVEPDGIRMLPDRLASLGIAGPDVGRLAAAGFLERGGRRIAPRGGERVPSRPTDGLRDGHRDVRRRRGAGRRGRPGGVRGHLRLRRPRSGPPLPPPHGRRRRAGGPRRRAPAGWSSPTSRSATRTSGCCSTRPPPSSTTWWRPRTCSGCRCLPGGADPVHRGARTPPGVRRGWRRGVAQRPLQDLARGVAGQLLVGEGDPGRHLEGGQRLGQEVLQLVGVEVGAGLAQDHAGHLLAQPVVGDAEHRRLVHVAVLVDGASTSAQ